MKPAGAADSFGAVDRLCRLFIFAAFDCQMDGQKAAPVGRIKFETPANRQEAVAW